MKKLKFASACLLSLPLLLVSSCNQSSEFYRSVNSVSSQADTAGSPQSPASDGSVAVDVPAGKPADVPADKPADKPLEKPAEKPADKIVDTKAPSEKDICDPLKEQGEEILYGHGLVGKLYDGNPSKIEHFSELLQKGKVLDGQIYMSRLNIPTRKFDKGFPREDGTMIMNSMGQVLIENFGIEFTGKLQLEDGDSPGYYEIGLISDDGSVLDVETSGGNVSIIDGDHQTPSKFFCSNQLVRMEVGKPVNIRLRWFQGPRYHIALILMWRKVMELEGSSSLLVKSQLKQPVKETRCGIAGNNFFFDPDSGSHPQMEYQDLFDPTKRVVPWSIIKHKNLRLPMGYSNESCVTKSNQ